VLFEGHPVTAGTVHVVVDDAKRSRYLASMAVSVAEDGAFRAGDIELPTNASASPDALRVTARFVGVTKDKDGKDRPLAGTSTVYLNYTPISARSIWGWIAVAVAFMLSCIVLFTGEMRKRKARLLFSMMYLMTFFSLAVPIVAALLVAQSQYVLEVMEEAPIGLVKGFAPGVSEGQWLINIGGSVNRNRSGVERVASSSTPGSSGPAPSTAESDSSAGLATVASSMSASGTTTLGREPFASVAGGLTVPFYVVLLAMLGAGINMTRRVPEIQQRYDHQLPPGDDRPVIRQALGFTGRLLAGGDDNGVAVPSGAAAEIRRQLVENYMYLLSAPFLAIAIYYLLQVIAEQVAQPVLVLMSFATGLTSDKIVGSIIRFAEKQLGDERPPAEGRRDADAAAAGPSEPSAASDPPPAIPAPVPAG
jgi:hypothetical protein